MSLTPTALMVLSVQAADWKATHTPVNCHAIGRVRWMRPAPGAS
ncbi:hypothetical protein [Deinococcus saxicola]